VKLIVLWALRWFKEQRWSGALLFPPKVGPANGERGAEEGKEEARHLKMGQQKIYSKELASAGARYTIESVNGFVGH